MSPSQIIFIPLPSQGHVAPMLYLSMILAKKGFDITFINTHDIHEALQKTWKATPGCDIRFESLPPDPFLDPGILALAKAQIRSQKPLAELIRTIHLRGPGVTCVISDFFHHSAALAARDAGLPSVGFFCGTAAWASVDIFMSELISNGDIPVKDGDDKLITYLPGLRVRSRDLPHYLHEGSFSEEGLELLLHRLKRTDVDSWLLIDGVYELEPEVFDALKGALQSKLAPVGLLVPGKDLTPVSLKVEDRSCLEWLDQQAPDSVLYISFGSAAVVSQEQFTELAVGLEASGQRFLWIIRSGLIPEMDEAFYQKLSERTRDRGRITEWCPQMEVLQHTSTGGFLTHSGWNSVKEGIIAGVPMLGYPCMLEQMLNTRMMIEGKGVGLCLERGDSRIVSRYEVESKIRVIMENTGSNKFRERALELSKVARKAAEPGGSSHTNLEQLITELLQIQDRAPPDPSCVLSPQ